MSAIRDSIKKQGLAGRCVCLHSSFRSFGGAARHPDEIVDAFLDEGCTLLVPTFSWGAHQVCPPDEARRPAQNGTDDDYVRALPSSALPFTTDAQTIDKAIGAIPVAVLQRANRARGDHPLCSFSAVGPQAREIVKDQSRENVIGSLASLAAADGLVVLAGVGLTSMTLLHLAEQEAGRRMFVRWAMVPEGVVQVRSGGCSTGFERLAPTLASRESRTRVGTSEWRVFPARAALDSATKAIASDPAITRCGDDDCLRCSDAVLGGPEW